MSGEDQRNIWLKEDDRERIRAEEIFREEIRKKIQTHTGPQKLHHRLWASRNSAFTLWLLSSVVLSIISWSYTQWQGSRTEQRKSESEFREIVTQAADVVNELRDAVMDHHRRVEQFLQENIRRLGRFYRWAAMQGSAELMIKAESNRPIRIQEIRAQMADAGSEAEWVFQVWLKVAKGDDADARAVMLKSFAEHRLKDKQDDRIYRALKKENDEWFKLIRRAIETEIILGDFSLQIERLAETIARKAGQIKALSKKFLSSDGSAPWFDENLEIWSRVYDRDIYHSIFVGFDRQIHTGLSEQFLERATLAEITDESIRKQTLFGLTQFELANAKWTRAQFEIETARVDTIEASAKRLFFAIHAAEDLGRSCQRELEMLLGKAWSRGLSDIPGLTETLRQRILYFGEIRDEVPKDILSLEKDAEAEIVTTRTYLKRILGIDTPVSPP